jgi:hypothetical protein
MDQTIAGAFSGESAGKPRRRRVHYLRQKDRRVIECFSVDFISISPFNGMISVVFCLVKPLHVFLACIYLFLRLETGDATSLFLLCKSRIPPVNRARSFLFINKNLSSVRKHHRQTIILEEASWNNNI